MAEEDKSNEGIKGVKRKDTGIEMEKRPVQRDPEEK